MASVNFFDKLSDDIIGACLIPCLGSSLHSISLLASVSKRFRKIICSNQYHESSFWADINVSICIDTYCPICNLNTNKVKFKKSAFSLLSSYPIENLQMHCFVSDIYDVLTSLISKQTIKNINLKLTNKLSSPPLVEILSQSIIPDCFQQLRSLTINSTNLNHVNLAGRVLILQLLGRNLEYLKFEGLTPVGIFKIISQVCVHLKNLRVDKVKSGVDFNELHSDTIEEIALCRAQFIPDNLKKFSRLSSLRYTSWAHLNGIQIEHIILSLPQSIKSLDMEIPSSFVDLMYLSVARRLPEIETLILESSHERGIISADVLLNLAHQCKCIKHFEIYSAQSVSDVILNQEAFLTLQEFQNIKTVKIKFKSMYIDVLPELLNSNSSINKIIFWERKRWLGHEKWDTMVENLNILSFSYPQVSFLLEDVAKMP